MTDAHSSPVTIRLIERWPAHEPRKSDPHYHLFEAAKHRLKRQGLLKCQVDSDYHVGQIELHHDKVEFAHINDIDLAKFNRAYGLELTDEEFQNYVEEEGNLEPLCLPGAATVLTPNGLRRIDSLRRGDRVISPDGRPRLITSLLRREYEGELVQIGSSFLTGDHPVLTPRGWLPAALVGEGEQLGQYIRVLGEKMRNMVAIEPQVLRSVIRTDMVDMVYPLLGAKGPSELLFHHEPVFEDATPSISLPDEATYVSSAGNVTAAENTFRRSLSSAGFTALRGVPAGIRAESLRELNTGSASPTPVADDFGRVFTAGILTANRRTGSRAGRVSMRYRGGDSIGRPAYNAQLISSCSRIRANAYWRPVDYVDRRYFSGFVYDLSVASLPAFITGDLIVHNCTLHHRGQEGVHSLPEPEWNVLRTAKNPQLVITALSNSEIPVQEPSDP